MWKEILNNVLGGGNQQPQFEVPEIVADKPDYTAAIIAAVGVLAILAVFYFITKKA